jgi:hypothetical protein
MLFRGKADSLDQTRGCVRRQHLAFVVVGKRRQRIVHELYTAAVEQCPIARCCYEHGPAAVIRYADDAAAFRNTFSPSNNVAT